MLYECYRCDKIVDENDGVIVYERTFVALSFIDNMVFICKNCLSKNGREKFEKAKGNSKLKK